MLKEDDQLANANVIQVVTQLVRRIEEEGAGETHLFKVTAATLRELCPGFAPVNRGNRDDRTRTGCRPNPAFLVGHSSHFERLLSLCFEPTAAC